MLTRLLDEMYEATRAALLQSMLVELPRAWEWMMVGNV